MTPEQRSAVERVRRVRNGEEAYAVYGQHVDAHALHWRDLGQVADAYLAEHLPDDEEPVMLDFMESVVPEDGSITIATHGEVGRVYLDESYVADGIKIKTRGQLRYLLKGLGR